MSDSPDEQRSEDDQQTTARRASDSKTPDSKTPDRATLDSKTSDTATPDSAVKGEKVGLTKAAKKTAREKKTQEKKTGGKKAGEKKGEVTSTGREDPDEVDPGETLLYEPGGSWWVVSIGPIMIAAILIMEIVGKGAIHWGFLLITGVILVGFSVLQVVAARQHVSMRLTETTLRQGRETIKVADIVKIFPPNTGSEPMDWESAPALGELYAVPRRRKGIGVRLANGRLAQAWARDVERLRTELTEAHLAVTMGLPPKGKK